MSFIENLKNVVFNPRDFAVDQLDNTWEWWKYTLILLLLTILPHIALNILTIKNPIYILIAIINFTIAIGIIAGLNKAISNKKLFITSFEVSLSFITYVIILFAMISAILIGAIIPMYFINIETMKIFGAFGYLIVAFVSVIFSIILIKNFCQILSEINNCSAWKVFAYWLMFYIIGFVIIMITTTITTLSIAKF